MEPLVLHSGRPADAAGRMTKELECYDLLDSLGVVYERVDHEPAAGMEICDEIDKSLNAEICKNLLLTNKQQTLFFLLMIPAHKRFKTKDLSPQLGCARLSFASGQQMEELINCTPGSASVLGLMHDAANKVQLLVDEEVLASEYVGCHPCINTSSLRIRTADVFGPILDAMHHNYISVRLPAE